MARSIWRTQVAELRKRLPGIQGRAVSGIVMTIVGTGEGGAKRIGGISYTAVVGHEHPLDGQSVDFGDRGVERTKCHRRGVSCWSALMEPGGPINPILTPSQARVQTGVSTYQVGHISRARCPDL
jgi:hypothetical protein